MTCPECRSLPQLLVPLPFVDSYRSEVLLGLGASKKEAFVRPRPTDMRCVWCGAEWNQPDRMRRDRVLAS